MARSDKTVTASLAHKLKGVAGTLAIQEVATLAGEVGHALDAGENPAESLMRLQTSLDTALASIERYAPPPDIHAENIQSDAFDPVQLAPLLARILEALNTDSPTTVRPILAELDKVLPPVRLAALHTAIENFDFRGGEAATRSLADELFISLGD
jgi:HPt (histidine-containing phosphotransfer) domain-containing protein